jgi:proliferating cell nuclear antigen
LGRKYRVYSFALPGVTVMLNATISRDVLETIVTPATTLERGQLLQVESGGVKIHATDKSREAIIEIWAPETIFESYCANSMETGIDLSKVAEFLNVVDGIDRIQIEINAEQERVTLIAGRLSYTFSLVISDDIPQALAPLDTEQPATVTIQSRKLDVPIELAEIAGLRVQFSVDPDPTTFSGTTNGVRDSLCFEFNTADVNQFQGSGSGISVSLDYFAPIQRAIPDDTLVQFELGNHKHIRLQYPISDGAGTVTVTFAGVAL